MWPWPNCRRERLQNTQLITENVTGRLDITDRVARSLVEAACERDILAKMGNAKRGTFYQLPGLIAILEEASGMQGIRRIAAR